MGISEDIRLFETKLNEAINESMQTVVAETIRTKMQNAIESEVYGRYEPSDSEYGYVRKRENGGLQDRDNMVITSFDDATHELVIQNMRSDGRLVAPVVVSGEGYTWEGSRIYQAPFPRDFYEVTDKMMSADNDVEDALRMGIETHGFVFG